MEVKRVINDAHSMQITCCAFNQTRRELFSGGQDALVKVWDVESGKLLRVLTGHSGWVTDLLFVHGDFPIAGPGSGASGPPSTGLLLSSSIDGSVIVWSDRGRMLQRLEHTAGGPCFCLGYEKKRKLVVCGGEKIVCFYRVASGSAVGTGGATSGSAGSFPGLMVDAGSGTTGRLGGHHHALGGDHASGITAVQDAIVQKQQGSIHTKVLRALCTLKSHTDLVRGIACSDSGRIFSVGYDRRICSYDSENPRETCVATNKCHEGAICSVALNSVNNWLITGSYDGMVKIWSQDMRCLEVLDSVGDTVTGVCHIPAMATYWVTGRNRRLLAFDAKSPSNITDVVTETSQFEKFSVQKLMATRYGTDAVAGITTARQLVVWEYNPCAAFRVLRAHHDWVEALCVVHSGVAKGNVFTSGADGLLLRWQQSTSLGADSYTCSDQMLGHTGPVLCIAHCEDLDLLVTGSEDATIRLWHIHDHASGSGASTSGTHAAAMAANGTCPHGFVGHLAGGGGDPNAGGMHMLGDEKLHDYNVLKGHESRVSAVCCCAEQVLASVSHDHSLRFWDLHTKSELCAVQRAHDSPITCVEYCAQNHEVATCAHEETVKVWNAHRHTLKYVLRLQAEATCVSWCRFFSCWVTGEETGIIKLWANRRPKIAEVAELYGIEGGVLGSDGDGGGAVAELEEEAQEQYADLHMGSSATARRGSASTMSGALLDDDCKVMVGVLHHPGECATSLSIDEENKLIMAAMQDHSLRAFKIEASTLRPQQAPSTAAHVASGGNNRHGSSGDYTTMRKQEQALLYLGHTDVIRGIVHVPSKGHYLTVSWDKTMRAWLAPTATSSSAPVGSAAAGRTVEWMADKQRKLKQTTSSLSSAGADVGGGGGLSSPYGPSSGGGATVGDGDDDFVSSYEKQHPLLVPRALKQNVKRGSISRLPTGMTGTAAASTTSGETTIRRVIVS